MHKIKNIIWDIDGTLIDSYPPIVAAFSKAVKDFGFQPDDEKIYQLAIISLDHCFATLEKEFQIERDKLETRFDVHYGTVVPEDNPAFRGAREICEYIVDNGGKNVVVTHRGRQGAELLLEGNRLAEFFSGVVAGDDGYARKPHPAAFFAALAQYGLNPQETITVGDRAIDMQAEKAAGIFSVLFGENGCGADADLTIRDYEELQRYIIQQNQKSH